MKGFFTKEQSQVKGGELRKESKGINL